MGHLDTQRSMPAIRLNNGGFSPMAKKLRLASEHKVAILNAPKGYLEQLKPGPADMVTQLEASQVYDVVQRFANDTDELRRLGPAAIRAIKPNGFLWITCPKGGKTRGATVVPATPWWVQRDVLGAITSQSGYRPVAFVAVDENWTALRFKRE